MENNHFTDGIFIEPDRDQCLFDFDIENIALTDVSTV